MKLTKLNELIEEGEIIKGRWLITPNHEIQYKSKGKDEEIKVKGSLITAEPDALVIALTERQLDQKIVTGILKLVGAWKLDLKNQIIFEVARGKGDIDVLTFKGAWRVGGSNEIIYTYERRNLKTKKTEAEELVFTGFWDISEKNRLVYFLGAGSDSAFRFRGSFQTKSILAKSGEIRYQAGVELAGKRKIRAITLFGKWKLSRDLGLSFEMEHTDRKRSISFGGEYNFDGSREITASLKSEQGEPLGLEVVFTRNFFGGDGQAFARFQRSIAESRAEAGMRFRW